jgi:hypothetical protein
VQETVDFLQAVQLVGVLFLPIPASDRILTPLKGVDPMTLNENDLKACTQAAIVEMTGEKT